MSSFQVFVQSALARAGRGMVRRAAVGRWSLVLGVIAASLISAFGPPQAAVADTPPDPAARLQVLVKSFHIYDDRDLFGAGDEAWVVELCSAAASGFCGADSKQDTYGGDIPFHASGGADVTINYLLPQAGDSRTADVTPEAGMPVYSDRRYHLRFSMEDQDFVDGDDMGAIDTNLTEANGWDVGTHTVRSIHDDGSPGDYSATWEVRRAPLPDLTVKNMYIQDPAGSPLICAEIGNVGERPAASSTLTVEMEGRVLQTVPLPALDVGWTYPHCVNRSDLPPQKHNLVFSLDPERQISEMDEQDNVNSITVEALGPAPAPGSGLTAAAPAPSSSPEPKPTEANVDLSVRVIRLNGRVPDGKNDCKDGKNGATVVVKNGGQADAGAFTVRLSVDGNDLEEPVDGLAAGQERDIHFDNVQLKAGAHTLRAIVDPSHAIAEPKEDNNELTSTARCGTGG